MQETKEMWVWSLGQQDPLEEEMATHSSILAWKNSMDSGAWKATVYEVTKSDTIENTNTHTRSKLDGVIKSQIWLNTHTHKHTLVN